MKLISLTYNQLPIITAPKIHTDLLWDLSFLFIGLAVFYFLSVFFYRNRLSKRSWQVRERKKELSPMISEFLFYEEEASKDEKSNYVNLKIEIRQLLKDDFNRKVLSEVLLDLRKDVSGDTQKQLFKLYQDLGLHNDDFKRLKSWRWEFVSKAILNLTQMQVAEAYGFVTKFINDKRHTIRKQAEIAVVTLKPEGVNYFLDTTKYKISEWQQLKLMDVLRGDDDYQPPRFKAWLTSTNRHVVLFALRLIKFYNQNDADAALIELVKHKNSQIKEEAIGCIKEFHIVEALPTLKLVFWKSSIDVKISILNAIGVLGSTSDIEFLRLIEKKEANFSVRSKADASINTIAPDSIMPSKGLLNTANYTIPKDIKIDDELEEIADETSTAQDASTSNQIVTNEQEEATIEIVEETIEEPQEAEKEPSEKIIDNEAKTDLMEENQEQLKPETPEHIANQENLKEIKTLNFDFLPIIVDEVSETQVNPYSEQNADLELHEFIVEFEEVGSEEEVQSTQQKKPSFEITEEEITFLPVVSDDIEGVSVENKIEEESDKFVSIKDIKVEFDTIVPIDAIEVQFEEVTTEKEIQPTQQKKPSFEITEEEIAFLPVVSDNVEEVSIENKIEAVPDAIIAIEDIEVKFDTIVPIEAIEVKFEEVQIMAPKQEERPMLDYSDYQTPEILAVEVIYEEIDFPSKKAIENKNQPTEPYFLSEPEHSEADTMDVQSKANPQPLQTHEDMDPKDEQKFKKIIQDLIEFNERKQSDKTKEKFQNGPLPNFEEEFLNTDELNRSDKKTEEVPEVDSAEDVEETVDHKSTVAIPKAILGDDNFDNPNIYKENTEESRMQLLDDLAEMGDEREIPLLKELLVNEKYKTVIARVEGLIARFSKPEAKPETEPLLKPFNVFEDLFRTCDTEAKLILMDEIVAVGDEGEINFLEDLLENEEKEISNKAARILEELRLKLSKPVDKTPDVSSLKTNAKAITKKEVLVEKEIHEEYNSLMEELHIAPPKEPAIFEVNFELTEPLTGLVEDSTLENKPSEKSANQESLLGQLCAFSNKIIDRLNG